MEMKEWVAAKCACGSTRTFDGLIEYKMIVGGGRRPNKLKMSLARAAVWFCTDCGRIWLAPEYREMVKDAYRKIGVE